MYTSIKRPSKADQEESDFAVFYVNDGKSMAEYIQKKFMDTRFNCKVSMHDLTDISKDLEQTEQSYTNTKVTVLVVSPSFLSFVTSSSDIKFNPFFPVPERTVVLYFYVDVSEAESVVKGLCSDTDKWTYKNTGDKGSLRECLVSLITLLEEDGGPPPPVLKKFTLLPTKVTSTTDKIFVIFNHEVEGPVEIYQDNEKKDACFYNPFIYTFKSADYPFLSGPSEVRVKVSGRSEGVDSLVYQSQTDELEHLLCSTANPLTLLCEAVVGEGSSVDMLDHTLNHMFCNASSVGKDQLDVTTGSQEVRRHEYPTLLHVAARFGLRHSCSSMLETPGGKLAEDVRNKHGLTPAQIAQKHEHDSLKPVFQASRPDKPKDAYAVRPPVEIPSQQTQKRNVASRNPRPNYDSVIVEPTSNLIDMQRSVSAPAAVNQELYIDMTGSKNLSDTKPGKEKEKKKEKPKGTSLVPDVVRRIRSKTVDEQGNEEKHNDIGQYGEKATKEISTTSQKDFARAKESARISLIRQDDLPELPPRTTPPETIYSTIGESLRRKNKSVKNEMQNRKS